MVSAFDTGFHGGRAEVRMLAGGLCIPEASFQGCAAWTALATVKSNAAERYCLTD
jgi:hypothetical protein